MTKKEMMLAMGYKPQFVDDLYCQKHYIQRLRKSTFIKALDLYNNVSHTKGKAFLDKAYWIKDNVVERRQCKFMVD